MVAGTTRQGVPPVGSSRHWRPALVGAAVPPPPADEDDGPHPFHHARAIRLVPATWLSSAMARPAT